MWRARARARAPCDKKAHKSGMETMWLTGALGLREPLKITPQADGPGAHAPHTRLTRAVLDEIAHVWLNTPPEPHPW